MPLFEPASSRKKDPEAFHKEGISVLSVHLLHDRGPRDQKVRAKAWRDLTDVLRGTIVMNHSSLWCSNGRQDDQ